MADDRLKKTSDPARVDRAMEDRAVTEKREISDDDRIAMFRQTMHQSALPDLPEIDGYHVCWLTTENPRDSIAQRVRLGYELIQPEDVPGYDVSSLKTAAYPGAIGVNEMIAMKISDRLYQAYMRHSHHDQPLSEEQKLADTAKFIRDQAQAQGADIHVGEGTEELRKTRQAPVRF